MVAAFQTLLLPGVALHRRPRLCGCTRGAQPLVLVLVWVALYTDLGEHRPPRSPALVSGNLGQLPSMVGVEPGMAYVHGSLGLVMPREWGAPLHDDC